MSKTKKNYRKSCKGGKVIASGGFGCVFNPALKCEGESKRPTNKISKLMIDRHATNEYEEIDNIKSELDSIPNYKDYFLIYDIELCRPAKLTASDLTAFGAKCTALPKDDITKKNINDKLDEVMTLNIPNGGLPVDDYFYKDGSYQKMYDIHTALVKLLKKGIIPMNKKNIYHCDIKDSNVLIDDSGKARLIDWGLAVDYTPKKTVAFPRNWKNRPLQFNVPFSVIIFTDDFYTKYTDYLKKGGQIDEVALRPFVLDYLNFWMKERGAGHYKYINEIMYLLTNNDITSISDGSKPGLIETEFTLPTIIDYILDVLVNYTKYKSDGSLNLREYVDDVYIHIVDIWGFLTVYYPMLESLSKKYSVLSEDEMKIFAQLKFMYFEYLFNPRHEPINMTELFSDLKNLGNLIHIVIHGKSRSSSSKSALASGIRTRKKKTSSSVFKRSKFVKRFKNPYFLSLK